MLTSRRALATAALLGVSPMVARAQDRPVRRVALVIGNGAYRDGIPPLANPPRDARAVGAALTACRFTVEIILDASRAEMLAAIGRLGGAATGAEAALLYYAGHAMEVGGRNVLLPVGTGRPRGDGALLIRESVAFDEMSAALEGRAGTTMILLDACRDDPFGAAPPAARDPGGRGRGTGEVTRSVGGLASVRSGAGTLIAFATAPGQVALDGDGENSPFTTAFLQHVRTPGLEVREMLSRTRRSVREATAGRQVPWDNSSLEQPFYFFRARGSDDAPGAGRVNRVTLAAAAERGVPLPPNVTDMPFRRSGTPGDQLLGAWASTAGWNGGVGRHLMLLVFRADSNAGSAALIVASGPPTAGSRDQNPAAWQSRAATLRDGAIEWVTRDGLHYAFRVNVDGDMDGAILTGPNANPPNRRFGMRLRRVQEARAT